MLGLFKLLIFVYFFKDIQTSITCISDSSKILNCSSIQRRSFFILETTNAISKGTNGLKEKENPDCNSAFNQKLLVDTLKTNKQKNPAGTNCSD